LRCAIRVDRIIANGPAAFYLVILNRSLIGVQEESVHLLEQQLQDQQNRFEAGTVPAFQLSCKQRWLWPIQQPSLITARNNYRIAQLQLAKNHRPRLRTQRGERRHTLRCVGELTYSDARDAPCPWRLKLAKNDGRCSKQQRGQRYFVQLEAVHGRLRRISADDQCKRRLRMTSSTFSRFAQ
jgi:hypothetical protein